MNIDRKIKEELDSRDFDLMWFYDDNWEDFDSVEEANRLENGFAMIQMKQSHPMFKDMKGDIKLGGLRIKLPKKKFVDAGYIIDKVIKRVSTGSTNFRHIFEKLLNITGYSIYSTSFGFSVSTWQLSDDFHKDVNKISDLLDRHGVEYKNEYSDAHWVYRFKISKKRENLDKLKQIKEKIKQ